MAQATSHILSPLRSSTQPVAFHKNIETPNPSIADRKMVSECSRHPRLAHPGKGGYN